MIQYPDIETNDGSIVCSFPDGEFKNTKFTIGRVSLEEQANETLKLLFSYNVIENPPKEKRTQAFINAIGDFLTKEIEDRIKNKKELVFRGGIMDDNVTYEDEENYNGVEIEN